MNLRFLLVGAALLAAGSTLRPVVAASAPRPNFLLVIADDLNWRDLGCTGSPDVKSPNLDRLSREGMSLRAMFTPAPTCSPLRHALYTGLFPIRSGAYPNHTMVDRPTRSIFNHLKAAGYRVGLQAKSHGTAGTGSGFRYFSSRSGYAHMPRALEGEQALARSAQRLRRLNSGCIASH